ncbi:MAG TPA: hypothetical protein VFC24_03040 [Casimicrobiaceae bacterium]|nr:hypothetical protein [Casimicrobiaceae bacterium]
MAEKGMSAQELLYEILGRRHERHVEIGKLLERKRALEAELKQTEEKIAEAKHQMDGFNAEVKKYCRELIEP